MDGKEEGEAGRLGIQTSKNSCGLSLPVSKSWRRHWMMFGRVSLIISAKLKKVMCFHRYSSPHGTRGLQRLLFCVLFLAALRSRHGHYIFALWFLSFSYGYPME